MVGAVEQQGGLAGMAQRNKAKADLLYGAIESSDFYSNPVEPSARSWMNVPFLVPDAALEKPFVAQAAEAGLSSAVTDREADDLVRDVGAFLIVVENHLGAVPEPPRPTRPRVVGGTASEFRR